MHDNKLYHRQWKGRLPNVQDWKAAPISGRVIHAKARRKTLRTMRLKLVPPGARPRTGMIEAFEAYGPVVQINQSEIARKGSNALQNHILDTVDSFEPDLLILQAQGGVNITIDTIKAIYKARPEIVIVNFNGDARIPVPDYCIDIARVIDLSLIVSPDLFGCYAQCGVTNLAYWPITYEPEFARVERKPLAKLDSAVVFMGTHYISTAFPDAEQRKVAIESLVESGVRVRLYGAGWPKKYTIGRTDENHGLNAEVYASTKLALSISHFNDLYGYTSDRLYLACATGSPTLVKRFPGMEEHGFIDGDTCIAFDKPAELVQKSRYYLAHDNEREAIGQRAKAMTISRHSWSARASALLDMLRASAPTGLFGTQEYIAMHGLHGGRVIMAPCGGCGSKGNGNGGNAQPMMAAARDMHLAGAVAGMTAVVYVGRAHSKQTVTGPVTGINYEFKPGKPRYVDSRDLRTGNPQSATKGVLEYRADDGKLLYEEFGAPTPGPALDPVPPVDSQASSEPFELGFDTQSDVADEVSTSAKVSEPDAVEPVIEPAIEPITDLPAKRARELIQAGDIHALTIWLGQERASSSPRKTVLRDIQARLKTLAKAKVALDREHA